MVVIAVGALFVLTSQALAISCEDSCDDKSESDKPTCLNDVRQACEEKLAELGKTRQTLQSAIAYFDTQIAYTQSKINETTFQIKQLEGEIESLSGKISILNTSLGETTKLLLQRISATYKQTKVHPWTIFFSSNGVLDLINRYQYLRAAQVNDRRILFEMEEARANYDQQKNLKEEKQSEVLGLQTELISQKTTQDKQKKEKQFLLQTTNNDQKRYQELLDKATAELIAIQAIIAGYGNETEVREVNEGEKIAAIMTEGPNLLACSTGAHLHYEVDKDGVPQNPFSLLQSKSLNWDNPDPAQNGSGSWRWPLEDPIRVTQSFGSTSYSSRYAGGLHTGIDMINEVNRDVKATRKGMLFRGNISCRGGTLQYVRVEHSEDEYNSYYLHVNY